MVLGQRRYARGNDRRLGGGLILTCCVAGLCWIPWAAAEAGDDRPFRIGGLLFGDFYDVASHHTEEGDGATGLVSRRGYLTFDADRSTKCFGRLRFEVNQAGDNISYLPFDPMR